MDRYHRQSLLPFVGDAGQAKLAVARVLIVGCGALGGTVAEQLCRAGVGALLVVDRDWVEITNLQRQVLFDESDARHGTPKAVAAAARLSAINSAVTVEPHVTDVHADNIEALAAGVDVMIDATDNVETRYLINDVSIKHKRPWIYGGCVGAQGRVMTIYPGRSPCLRCVFPTLPAAGELATCDAAGVLGPAASVIASLQATAALRLLLEAADDQPTLLSIDVWHGRFTIVHVGDPDPACVCCGRREFQFLQSGSHRGSASLCGRDAVQVHTPRAAPINLEQLADRLRPSGEVQLNRYLLRCRPIDDTSLVMTVFPDGRVIVQGTHDLTRARTLVGRYLGI